MIEKSVSKGIISTYFEKAITLQMNILVNLKIKTNGFHILDFLIIYIFESSHHKVSGYADQLFPK